jgi:hypothetical protein
MSLPLATQILSFENFGSLEAHLRMLKSKYNDMIKKYEETLGYILRDTRAVSPKTQKVQEKWALDMQRAMASSAKAANAKVATKKEEKKPSSKMFGKGKDKDSEKKEAENSLEWIALDPMSIFVGPKNRGLAEIYFDTINVLRENINKINLALSICSTLKAKAASAGSASLIVSFVNDIPTKVLLKSADDGGAKKYTMAFSFAVPNAQTMSLK